MPPSPELYDTGLQKLRKARFLKNFAKFDFAHRFAAENIADRVACFNRAFDHALLEGVPEGFRDTPALVQILAKTGKAVFIEGVESLEPARYDLIISLLTLHNVNALPETLRLFREALKPDGVFIATIFDPACLFPVKMSLRKAELNMTNGAADRFHPAIDIRDFGGLASGAGFSLPVLETDYLDLAYKRPLDILKDISGAGEGCLLKTETPHPPLTKGILAEFEKIYAAENPKNSDGLFAAKLSVLTLTARAPSDAQRKPLKPGEGKVNLTDYFSSQTSADPTG